MNSNVHDSSVTQRTGGIAVTDQTHDNGNAQKIGLDPIPGTNGYQRTITIDPNQPLSLSVSNASGDVRIAGSDQPDIQIIARRRNGDANDGDPGISVSVDGNHISVRPDWQSMSGFGEAARALKTQIQEGLSKGKWNFSGVPKLGMNADFDFRVQVPRAPAPGSRINVKTASGEVDVENLSADVTVGTASGDIETKALSGQVAIHTASGDVEAHDITGSLEVNSASGDILVEGGDAWTALRTMSGDLAVTDSVLRNARVTTVSGDLAGVMTLDNDADYTFETVSGDLSLTCQLPGDAATRLSFRSISGEASINEGWTSTGKKEWRLGDGAKGPNIRTRSVSGNLRVAGARADNVHVRQEVARPAPSTDAAETTQPHSGIDEIKSYAAQAREMAEEMKRMFTPPAPPAAPAPPTAAAQSGTGAPQANLDAEQARRDAEQAQRDHEQALRDAEQAKRDAQQSGDWWSESATSETQATAPITPPVTQASTPQTTAPVDERITAVNDDDPKRRQVLEQVERGEIDIEEALNRLEQTDGENA